MRLVLATMTWGRPHIWAVWVQQVHRLQQQARYLGCELEVLICGSEGPASQSRAQQADFHYLEHPNAPLGAKANARYRAALALRPDAMLFLGDDDLMSTAALDHTIKALRLGADWVASMDLYFWWWKKGPYHMPGYGVGYTHPRASEPMAVGRALSARMLEALPVQGPWPEDCPRDIDLPMHQALQRARLQHGLRAHIYHHQYADTMVLALKNRHGLGAQRPHLPNEVPINAGLIAEQFGADMARLISHAEA